MSVAKRVFAATGAAALSFAVFAPAAPAYAQTVSPGGFADARGIIVDLVALTALPVPGPLAGSPLDPNTFSTSSQSCPPNAASPASNSLVSVPAAPAATADAVSTMASAKCSTSDAVSSAAAETANVKALFSGTTPTITADVIRAQANSSCTAPPNANGSQFVNLTIAGQAIPANPPANTVISLPGLATVIVNEQHPSATGRGIVVNGLHIIGASPLLRGDLIISHAVSGVACPNGPGSSLGGLPAPDISFSKSASPSTVTTAGALVTYTATVTNTSKNACDVVRLVDHLDPAFSYVSTAGVSGGKLGTPTTATRSDKGTDVIFEPTGLTLAPNAPLVQTVTAKLIAANPGTYYNNLEIFCAVNGDFASGPLAPVTVPAAGTPLSVGGPTTAPAVSAPQASLPRTGGAPLVAASALLLLLAAAGLRRALR